MTLKKIYEACVDIAKSHGYDESRVTFQTLITKDILRYSCHIWVHDKRKFIESDGHPNPDAMLKSLEDNIKYFQRTYSTEKQDSEL